MTTQTCVKKQPNPRRGRQSADFEAAAEAFALSVRGLSLRAIAAKLGVSATAAHGYLVAGRQQQIASIWRDAKERLADRHGALDASAASSAKCLTSP